MATKSAISFGLVHIPVSLHTATQDNDVHFNQLHKDDNSRIRYKKTCGHCGKEVTTQDIVKGFEYDKDQYVIVTDEEFEKIKTEKDRSMQIIHFTTLDTISPVYYDKTYHAIPETGGEKAFELLRTAMMQEKVVAVAKVVMGTKDTLITLIPREDGLLCQTMFFADEVKALPNYIRPEVDAPQLQMAQTLINGMKQDFAPEQYKDEYQEKLKDLISTKISGKEVVAGTSEQSSGGNVIDIMEALQKSIEATKENKPKKRTTKSKGA
ncbi:Ku protein (plasmid) [Oscillospiraceae bacterium MB08-C2-2]|nr:Ku protein [Oscillospiraceae bacterium MB08-C2-2]